MSDDKSTTIRIEKGISIPSRRKSIIDSMEVGDSFFVLSKRNQSGYHATAKSRGVKITVRREGDGYRVWRIK